MACTCLKVIDTFRSIEERERLQGFPRGYTSVVTVDEADDANINEHYRLLCRDGSPYGAGLDNLSARKKAIGNSMPVTVMAWLGKRIAEYDQLWEEACRLGRRLNGRTKPLEPNEISRNYRARRAEANGTVLGPQGRPPKYTGSAPMSDADRQLCRRFRLKHGRDMTDAEFQALKAERSRVHAQMAGASQDPAPVAETTLGERLRRSNVPD